MSPPSPDPEPVPACAASSAAGERAGDVIGRYELIEEIGEGGMGSVWRAQQSEPVKRDVAFKIIKLGMDTKEVVVRFEAERQALALMDHPHIAKVLDGGATGGGRPYFVMELVEGEPITDYCDRAKLGVRERLELFAKVCEGIQHAHQKGLIHRDIKPGNVLVALQDGEPVPKVIDFGIAKATGASLTEKTMHTELGQMLGTPEYMAPEQLGMSGLDIDTRADVYSLGVLLYELLTGTKPFDIQKIIETGYDELLRTIREVDPEKPSTRITKLDDTATVAELRQLDVRAFGKQLSGDLDWVVMKALEKDRARRYETANGFAADVQRYLDQEPVVAAPPSATYRLRKFVKRRKKTVAALATIAFLLLAGSIGTGVGLWRTMRANAKLDVALGEKDDALKEEERQRTLAQENEQRARAAERDARTEAKRATRAEAQAEARAAELEQVAEFQSSQLSDLDPQLMGVRLRRSLIDAAPANRRAALTEGLAGLNFTSLALQTLEENLFARTIEAIDTQFPDQPLVQAQLLGTVALTLRALGLLEMAKDPAQRALAIRRAELGDEHPDTLRSINAMATLLMGLGRLAEAEALCVEALETRRRLFGDDHLDTLVSIQNMGSLLWTQGRLAEAEARLREALDGRRRALGDEHRDTLESLNGVAYMLQAQGRLTDAEPYLREVLEVSQRVLGDEHPDTLRAINNMGGVLEVMGRTADSEPYFREALAGRRRVFGDEHPVTLESINNLGTVLQILGRLDESEPYVREALDGTRRVLGDTHPGTLAPVNSMGWLLERQGKPAQAEAHFREALDIAARVLGDDHPKTLGLMRNVSRLLGELERSAREDGDEDRLGAILADLGALRLREGRGAAAEQVLGEAVEVIARAGAEESLLYRALSGLGAAVAAQGRYADAEPMLRESAEWMRAHPTDPAAASALQRMVDSYAGWHAAEPGQGYDAKAAEWRGIFETWHTEHGEEAE